MQSHELVKLAQRALDAQRTIAPMMPAVRAAQQAQKVLEPARRMQRTFGPVLRMAADANAAVRRRHAAPVHPCERRQRPRQRRHATRRAAGCRSGTDPGDASGDSEPPGGLAVGPGTWLLRAAATPSGGMA
jgi:hypothetical protein